MKKTISKTKIILVIIVAVIAVSALIYFTVFKSQNSDQEKINCTISIDYSAIYSNSDILPSEKIGLLYPDGIILPATQIDIAKGSTAFDVLKQVVRQNKLHLDFDNTAYGAYITGIGNIYAGDYGDMSAWMFLVNGKGAEVGCSQYTISDGDEIRFAYSCDFGADLGITY